mmetsp:Transcript_41980/g.57079  ORF Transcript_41980/g.57079 Transcript_41980/m.57079 type:complete len:92 (+) Transcript_41980:164-439(+)
MSVRSAGSAGDRWELPRGVVFPRGVAPPPKEEWLPARGVLDPRVLLRGVPGGITCENASLLLLKEAPFLGEREPPLPSAPGERGRPASVPA